MSSKYGFSKVDVAPLHTTDAHPTALLSRIEPVVTDILSDVLHTYGEPHRDCVGCEPLNSAQIFAVWTAPNIALFHPDDKKPLIVQFREISKHRLLSTIHNHRLELLWGHNEQVTEEHRSILYRIAEVLRDKTNLTVAVMSWAKTHSAHGVAHFNEEKIFEAQAG